MKNVDCVLSTYDKFENTASNIRFADRRGVAVPHGFTVYGNIIDIEITNLNSQYDVMKLISDVGLDVQVLLEKDKQPNFLSSTSTKIEEEE